MTTNPGNSSSPPQQATFREFLAVIFRRRWIILGIFLVTTATVVAVVFTTPLVYVSSGRVLLKRGEQTSALQSGRQVVDAWEQDLGSEVELAKSEPVLEHARAILEREAAGKPVPLDASSLDVKVLGKSNVLAIDYVSSDPENARLACDAVLRGYVEFRQTTLGMISYPKAFFEQSLADVSRDLASALDQRREYARRTQTTDVIEERRSMITEMASLRLRESELNTNLAEAQANVRVLRGLGSSADSEKPVPPNPTGADAIYELKHRIVEQEARIAQLLERYRDDAPEVMNGRQTVQKLRDLYEREVNARIELALSRVEVVESQLQSVRKDLDAYRTRLAEMPGKENDLGELDRKIEVLRDRYAELVEKSDLARVTQNTTPNLTVLVLDRAGTAAPGNARDWVRLGLAPAFSLLVGIGIAFFIDGLDITVRTAGQAEEAGDIPVLASLSERRRRRRA